MNDLWQAVASIKTDVLLSGFLGGVARWAALRTNITEGLSAIVVGVLFAAYLSDPLADIFWNVGVSFGVDLEIKESTAGFLVGITGVTMTGLIIDVVKIFQKKKLEQGHNNDG